MLSGASATQVCFQINNDASFLPSDFDGTTLPPRGSPNYVTSIFDNNNAELRKFHVDFDTPSNSTFTDPPTLIPVTGFTPLCFVNNTTPLTCVPQPITTQKLDS